MTCDARKSRREVQQFVGVNLKVAIKILGNSTKH
jgi:hypothetical protein